MIICTVLSWCPRTMYGDSAPPTLAHASAPMGLAVRGIFAPRPTAQKVREVPENYTSRNLGDKLGRDMPRDVPRHGARMSWCRARGSSSTFG